MMVTMQRQVFDSLDDAALVWACIGPAIQPVRRKDIAAKSRALAELTAGQRALFMFQVLYGHAGHGVTAFFG